MSIRMSFLTAALLAGLTTAALAADHQTETAAPVAQSFGSEAEFVAMFGDHAQKVGKGQYRVEHGDTRYEVNFGVAAVRANLREANSQLEYLSRNGDGSAKQAGDREQLQRRAEQLSRRLGALTDEGAKGFGYDEDRRSTSQCGFNVALLAMAAPQMTSGFARSRATVTSAGTVPSGGWHAVIDLYATAAQPNFAGGLYGRVDDYVHHDSTNNTVSPRDAYANTGLAWNYCLRATGSVEVISPSQYLFFPNYCGPSINVIAQHSDPACPTYY